MSRRNSLYLRFAVYFGATFLLGGLSLACLLVAGMVLNAEDQQSMSSWGRLCMVLSMPTGLLGGVLVGSLIREAYLYAHPKSATA
jgi:hypothetical protein